MGIRTDILLKREFGINESILKLSASVEKQIEDELKEIEKIKEFNQLKVIKAMQENKLSDSHFSGTTGYGYDDRGRQVLDSIYASVFKTEDALVRHQIVSGTQALAICMYGNLRPGDELLSISGKPYDTLEEVIGIRGSGEGSLKDFGIYYSHTELTKDGKFDLPAIKNAINEKTKMIFIQRSRGYNWRTSLTISDIKSIIEYIRDIKKDVIVLVDNCYGEFVEEQEPTEIGADLVAGSLIKNPGGGLALTGGYIAGKERYVRNSAYRLTSPGLGKKVGSTLGNNRNFLQGLFMAPHIVAESLKGAVYCSLFMQSLGFRVSPLMEEKRSDIIQAIMFNDPDTLIAFCQGIQKGSPVDSFVTPEPWDMPGYDCPVIMAAGAFVQGASIELSADAPIKPPYIAYLQGGLVYEHVKLGIMTAVQKMLDRGIIKGV
ncbi:MAG: methionine gamma-lyase family protein [Clostridia bacterium]|jgi:cystathionine beta-lyase family protein involved in aluminum resistance